MTREVAMFIKTEAKSKLNMIMCHPIYVYNKHCLIIGLEAIIYYLSYPFNGIDQRYSYAK